MCNTDKSPSKLKMANTLSLMTNAIRNRVSKQRIRYTDNGYNLDLAYICENIIAMGYPADNYESIYRNRIEDVYKFLEENHVDHYKIYNLCSERSYDINKFHGRVAVYGFDDHNPPTIELIQKFCDDVDRWLKTNEGNVAAVHCKAGKGRTGTMICCYLLHSGFAKTADEALGFYDEKRTKDKKGVTIPSQRRYVDYYSKLIRSGKPYQRRTLQLYEIKFSTPPLNFGQGSAICIISTLQNLTPTENSQLNIDFRKTLSIELKDLFLTGDVKIEVTHKIIKGYRTYFHFWFNTFFISDEAERHPDNENYKLVYEFRKHELDDAHKDKEHKNFTEDFTVQLVFKLVNERIDTQINQITQNSNNYYGTTINGICNFIEKDKTFSNNHRQHHYGNSQKPPLSNHDETDSIDKKKQQYQLSLNLGAASCSQHNNENITTKRDRNLYSPTKDLLTNKEHNLNVQPPSNNISDFPITKPINNTPSQKNNSITTNSASKATTVSAPNSSSSSISSVTTTSEEDAIGEDWESGESTYL